MENRNYTYIQLICFQVIYMEMVQSYHRQVRAEV